MQTESANTLTLRFKHVFAARQGGFAGNRHPFTLDVALSLPASGVTAIFGASGSGKTTLLRCAAGLQRVHDGVCRLGNSVWQDESGFTPVHRRPLGYVFQEPSLFHHLTVRANLQFAVRRAWDKPAAAQQLPSVIQLLGLQNRLEHYPSQLSGGERQRVAIARAVLVQPRILLMDEPLASLDRPRKKEILPYLERLREQLQIPMLYVTHSINEVARLADHLVLLDDGGVTAQGPLNELLSRLDLPVDLGDDSGAVLEVKVVERDPRWHLVRAVFDGGDMWISDDGHAVGDRVRLRVLARDVSLALGPVPDTSIINRLPAQVLQIGNDEGAMVLLRLGMGTARLLAKISRRSAFELGLQPGKEVWAQIKTVAVIH